MRKMMMLATAAVLMAMAGRPLTPADCLVNIEEVPDGNWSAGGKVLRLQDIAAYVRARHSKA